jgi:hypothetical protein
MLTQNVLLINFGMVSPKLNCVAFIKGAWTSLRSFPPLSVSKYPWGKKRKKKNTPPDGAK